MGKASTALYLASLRAAHASEPGATAWFAARRAEIARGELPAETLADVALLLLETLGEADGWLDMTAAGILTAEGDARHLARLRAVRPALRPRVALRDWRFEVDRAIATIATRAAGACTCAVNAAHGAPSSGPEWIVESETSPEPYRIVRVVRCAQCGRRWTVDEDHGYHYPTSRWRG